MKPLPLPFTPLSLGSDTVSVKSLRCHICSVWPRCSPIFYCHELEVTRVFEIFENSLSQIWFHIEYSLLAVLKRQCKLVFAERVNLGYNDGDGRSRISTIGNLLAERVDFEGLAFAACELPDRSKFVGVDERLGADHGFLLAGRVSGEQFSLERKRSFAALIPRAEVRRHVVVKLHGDYYSVEHTNCRHNPSNAHFECSHCDADLTVSCGM